MLKHVSRLWGYTETQAESNFDPLVGLLLEACATELEKVSADIHASRARIMERLVSLLSPETLTGALPAHALASAMPLENNAVTEPDMQFYTRLKLGINGENQEPLAKDIYFSPTGRFPLRNAAVRLMVIGNQLFKINGNQKEALATSSQAQSDNVVWVGIGNPEIGLHETSFYFDFRNEADRELFYRQLPHAKWFINEAPLAHKVGLNTVENTQNWQETIGSDQPVGNRFRQVARDTNQFYRSCFITLLDPDGATLHTKEVCDQGILESFQGKEADEFRTKPIRWIKILFPEIISGTQLKDLVCIMNCFPVMNRQVHEINFRMQDIINVIPLLSADLFLDLEKVQTDENQTLPAARGKEREGDLPIQVMRQGGIGRFDERDASDIINYLLQLLRDESAAFTMLDNDFVTKEMKNLKQVMNKLEYRLTTGQVQKGSTPYLVIQQEQQGSKPNLTIQYSSTYGKMSNQIKPGTRLLPYNGGSFISNNVILVSQSLGGRDELTATDKVLAYKSALLSKDRLTSAEDIKVFCASEMGPMVMEIKINKGIISLPDTKTGYQKSIDVEITLKEGVHKIMTQSGELEYWKTHLTQVLEHKTMIWMPLRVQFK